VIHRRLWNRLGRSRFGIAALPGAADRIKREYVPTIARLIVRGGHVWIGTIGVMAIVTALALQTPLTHALFPELAALSCGILSEPSGAWASKPWALAVVPTFAAILGVELNARLGFSPVSVGLSVASTLIILTILRSAVTPSLSAGLLALVLGISDPLYPVAIFVGGLVVIGVEALFVRGLGTAVRGESPPQTLLQPARRRSFSGPLLVIAFAIALAFAAWETGLRFLLFPPLVVLTYEMLADPACPWARRPISTSFGCLLAAAVGLAVYTLFGVSILAVSLSVVAGMLMLQSVRLFMPPALAVGLLPFVMHDPTWVFPLLVFGGIMVAVAFYEGFRCFRDTPSFRVRFRGP